MDKQIKMFEHKYEAKKLPTLRPSFKADLRVTLSNPLRAGSGRVYPRHLTRPKSRNEHHDIKLTEKSSDTPGLKLEPSGFPLKWAKTIDTAEFSDIAIPNRIPSKVSSKENGYVTAYAANTSPGLFRNYNEDRVAIILNFVRPTHIFSKNWPKCSFFGVYDGHGGSSCADFLRDNLHHFIVGSRFFPDNVELAIRRGFERAETEFLQKVDAKSEPLDGSGSCALILLVVEAKCYVANVGDSRAVLSTHKGKNVLELTRDHKPEDELEQRRILANGGSIYRTSNQITGITQPPLRVFPGRLSVSRTIGDIHAKFPKYGGNPKVVIAEPDIKVFSLDETCDFAFLGCDGIFDRLSNTDVVSCIWRTFRNESDPNLHSLCGKSVENVMKAALALNTLDNITGVLVTFIKDFENKHETVTPDKLPAYATARFHSNRDFSPNRILPAKGPIIKRGILDKLILGKESTERNPAFITHDSTSIKYRTAPIKQTLKGTKPRTLPKMVDDCKKSRIINHRTIKSFELKRGFHCT